MLLPSMCIGLVDGGYIIRIYQSGMSFRRYIEKMEMEAYVIIPTCEGHMTSNYTTYANYTVYSTHTSTAAVNRSCTLRLASRGFLTTHSVPTVYRNGI
jgi:hypothetical protein